MEYAGYGWESGKNFFYRRGALNKSAEPANVIKIYCLYQDMEISSANAMVPACCRAGTIANLPLIMLFAKKIVISAILAPEILSLFFFDQA